MENVEEIGDVPGPGASLHFVASVEVLYFHPWVVPFFCYGTKYSGYAILFHLH
jgi:hypothetical protein